MWTPCGLHMEGLEWMGTRDRLGMDWTRSGWTTGGLHVDSHRIPRGVKYTVFQALSEGQTLSQLYKKGWTSLISIPMRYQS